jgi:hypothetical protein
MSELFESAWLKWARAVMHGHVLETRIDAFASNPSRKASLTIGKRYDPRRHGIVLYVEHINPLPDLWRVILGDAVHNYRSCLDNLAWAIVGRGKTPHQTLTEAQQKRISFPIYGDRQKFNKGLEQTLPGAFQRDTKLVRLVQPFHYASRNQDRHWLEALRKLSDGDKHRTLQPIWALPEGGAFGPSAEQDCIVRRLSPRARRKALQNDAEIGVFYVKKTGPDPDIELHGYLSTEPALHPRLRVKDWLHKTRDVSRRLLLAFEQPPADLLERIGLSEDS